MYNEGVCNNESCFMPKTKIPVYFFKNEENSTIKCKYVTPIELYKISHHEDSTDNKQFYLQFIGIDNMGEPHAIGINLEVIEDLYKQYISQSQQISQPDSEETNTTNSDSEGIYTINLENEESDTINSDSEGIYTINLENEEINTINSDSEGIYTINLENEESDIIISDSEEPEIIISDNEEPDIMILDSEETDTINLEGEKIDTIRPINYNDLLNDNSKTLYRCIDIYGNIVEVFIPNDEINDKQYWITQAQQYKLLCNFDYLPFHYSSRDEGLEEVRKEMIKKICGETTVYCFYDIEREGEYYKCYGIKFPVEETEEMLQTIKSQSLESFTNDFPKVKIYYKDEIKEELKSNYFFHETSFKIGDTEINLTPNKEEMKKLNSLPKYEATAGILLNEKKKIITLIDSNEAKNYLAAINENFVARITINKDSEDYGKVMEVKFGTKKDTGKEYTAEEARKLLLVNCARKYKKLSKSFAESVLDIVLSNPKYYTSEDCPVRLPNFYKIITSDNSTMELEQELKLCTDNLSNGSNMIIPIANTFHMFVITATKKNDKISFKIFDPSTALRLENKENIKQELGDYIYDNLEEEKNYILSPKERIQNTLAEHNPIFDPACTGISTEYINYIIDKKQDKNPQKLTKEQGEEIQKRYATLVVNNGLHHVISGEQQTEQQAVKQETKSQNKPSVKENKTVVEKKPQEQPVVKNEIVDKKPISTSTAIKKKDPNSKPIKIETKPQDKPSVEEKKTVIEEKPQEQPVVKNEVVDKKEIKPEAVSVAVNDTDKKPIKEEITVRNVPVEKSKQYFIKTEFANGKLNMSLIEYKTEEHKKDFVKFCNDNHILFTKGTDGYGCLFNEDTANKIINDNTTTNRYNNIFIYTDNKYVSKNEYMQKKREEEQKKKEEEQKKKEKEQKKNGLSGISSLKDINKDNKVEETSKGGFNFISKLSNLFGKKSANSEKQTLLNTSEEKKTSKGRWWSKNKKDSHEL